MNNNFDEIINRKNTSCVKYDALDKYFGYEDLQPLWVADMDFKTPDVIIDALRNKVDFGMFGYPIATNKTNNLVKASIKKTWLGY